ncbi:MAG: hypothetical protein EBR01_10480 [Proteobacteria bacterium]|nr:hypothetical protein [Pseudomonadota bacterium]
MILRLNFTPILFFCLTIFFVPFLNGAEPGQVGPGLARLVASLSPDDPMAQRFQRMLKEIEGTIPHEKMVSAIDMGDKEIARFIPYPAPSREYKQGESPYASAPHIAIFQYNPDKLRIIDFLEEEQHWEQIKKGLHLRKWSTHPLVKKFPDRGRVLVLEDLAKKAVLENYGKQMSWDLREEIQRDLKLVWDGSYGAMKGAHLATDIGPRKSCAILLIPLKTGF